MGLDPSTTTECSEYSEYIGTAPAKSRLQPSKSPLGCFKEATLRSAEMISLPSRQATMQRFLPG